MMRMLKNTLFTHPYLDNTLFKTLCGISEICEDRLTSGSGSISGWEDRPIDHTGEQIEEGDIIALRCLLKPIRDYLATAPREPDIEGIGDPYDVEGEGKWVSIMDRDNDGGNWCKVVDGKFDDAWQMIVRRLDDDFELEICNKWAFMETSMANNGWWVNSWAYKPSTEQHVLRDTFRDRRKMICTPTADGYEIRFKSNDNAVSMLSDFLNVGGAGAELWFIFVHLGRDEEGLWSPDSGVGFPKADDGDQFPRNRAKFPWAGVAA